MAEWEQNTKRATARYPALDAGFDRYQDQLDEETSARVARSHGITSQQLRAILTEAAQKNWFATSR
jgi:hypothetical protein